MKRLQRTIAIANRRRQYFMSKKKYNSDIELEKELINDGFIKQDVYSPALAQNCPQVEQTKSPKAKTENLETPIDFSLE